jgi:hypothetical protein
MLKRNRATAAAEARADPNYVGDTRVTLESGASVDLPSLQVVCDGVYCTRSYGLNYSRSQVAFWCLYSNKGLPLYVYRLQISCKKCIHQWNKEGNFEHGGECYRTKGCTNIMLVEPQGSQQLGQGYLMATLEPSPSFRKNCRTHFTG